MLIMDMKRIFLDCETTGTDSRIHCIHQLSGCLEINGKIVEKFDYRIRPFEGCVIDKKALEVSHIGVETIMNYPPEMESYYEFRNMLSRYISVFDKTEKFFIIGYNVKFDVDFINAMFLRNSDVFFYTLCWGNVIDVMSLASDMLATIRHEMVDFKLVTVCKQIGLNIDDEKLHDAEYDIEITRDLYYICKRPDIYDVNVNQECKLIADLFTPTYPDNVPCEFVTDIYDRPNFMDLVSQHIDEQAQQAQQDEIQVSAQQDENDRPNFMDLVSQPMGIEALNQMKRFFNNIDEVSQNEIEAAKMDIQSTFLKPTATESIKISHIENKDDIKLIDSEDLIINFGKHNGKNINEIIKYDPQYIIWIHENHIKKIVISNEILSKCYRQKTKLDNSTTLNFNHNSIIKDTDLPF